MTVERPLRPLLLLDTTGFLSGGSMSRYLRLLLDGAAASPMHGRSVEVLQVGLSATALSWLPTRARTLIHHLMAYAKTAWMSRRRRPALVHVIDGSHAYLLAAVPADIARVVTVHDLIPLLQAEGRLGRERPSRFGHWLARRGLHALASADGLIAVSASTLSDLATRAPAAAARCRVVHSALRSLDAASESPLAADPYLLHVGNDGFYKNRDGLLRIFAGIARQWPIHLILVGPELSAAQAAFLAQEHLQRRVQIRPRVDEAQLSALYRGAALFLFPSLYEGYGWPPLEAMALGCPVLCSDRASLPELVGDAAQLCDPEDEPAFVAAAVRLLNDPAQCAVLRARGQQWVQRYSLQQMTESVSAVYAEALARKTRS